MYNFLDIIFYFLLLIPLLYYLIFSFSGKIKTNVVRTHTARKHLNYAIIIPAYKEDNVILNTLNHLIKQNYNKDNYTIFVAADSMGEAIMEKISHLDITIININEEVSSKAKALITTMDSIEGNYDGVIILDADNNVNSCFLSDIDDIFDGKSVLQLHRTSKNCDSQISMLDSISEEINNSIFRKGHTNIGFPSALIGSGIVFPFIWFKNNVKNLKTFAEDKELELFCIQDKLNIDYIEDIYVYDEKINNKTSFARQRHRWINTQYLMFINAFKIIPFRDIISNIALLDKLFQWILPPRLIIFCFNIIFPLIFLILYPSSTSYKWILNIVLIFGIIILSVPCEYLKEKRFYTSLLKIPLLLLITIMNIFKIKLKMNNFGATNHGLNQ